jgi:hypothetical protein
VQFNLYMSFIFNKLLKHTMLILVYFMSVTSLLLGSRDTIFGIMTRVRSGRPRTEVQLSTGTRYFSFLHRVQNVFAPTQPPAQWILEILSLVVKRPDSETHHSPASNAEVKNGGTIHLRGIYLI